MRSADVPMKNAPVVFQVGGCNSCITDTIMTRLAAVKHARIMNLVEDRQNAAGEIMDARKRASSARYERRFERSKARSETELDPEVEAKAARRLAEEELIQAMKLFDHPPAQIRLDSALEADPGRGVRIGRPRPGENHDGVRPTWAS